jgi:hypothetical protein
MSMHSVKERGGGARAVWVILGAVLLLCLHLVPAEAQSTRYVATSGSNANTCGLVAPCRTFQRAHDVSQPGYKIIALDSGDFDSVVITKSIAIVARGVDAHLSTAIAPSPTKIAINAGANDVIYLEGLSMGQNVAAAGASGILFNSGARLHVRNCVIRNFGDAGINIKTSGASRTTISDCVIANNRHAVFVHPAGATSNVVQLDRVMLDGNTGIGIRTVGSGAVVRVSNSTIVNNNRGFAAASGSSIVSFSNNVVIGNAVDGNPTAAVAMK